MAMAIETIRASLARGIFRSRTPESHANFSKTFAELGVNGPQSRNIGLEHVPTEFIHFSDGSDQVHIAVLDSAFAGEGLNNLLAAVAPTRPIVLNIRATTADLDLPDRARAYERRQRREPEEYGAKELDLHRRHSESPFIGPAYNEFDQHNREAILRALREAPAGINDLNHAAWHTRFIDPQTFGRVYIREVFASIEQEVRMFQGKFDEENTEERIHQRALYNLAERVLRRSPKAASIFEAFLTREHGIEKRYWDLTEEFMTSSDPTVVQALNEFAIEHAQAAGVTVVDVQSRRIYPGIPYKPVNQEGGAKPYESRLQTQLLPSGEVEYINTIGRDRISIRLAPSGDVNKPCNWRVVETNIPARLQSHALSPVIAYRVRHVNDERGEREERVYLTQPELLSLLKQHRLRLPKGMNPDVALGRIAMAYLSPEQVENWAAELPLQPGGKLQRINEAQAPILYAISQHNSPQLQSHHREGYADRLLSLGNQAVRVIENTA